LAPASNTACDTSRVLIVGSVVIFPPLPVVGLPGKGCGFQDQVHGDLDELHVDRHYNN